MTTARPRFPTDAFATPAEKPLSDELAADLQQVLEDAAGTDGMMATLITPDEARAARPAPPTEFER